MASPSLPHRAVRQAQGLLWAAEGLANEEIGRRVGVSANTVRSWVTPWRSGASNRSGCSPRAVVGVRGWQRARRQRSCGSHSPLRRMTPRRIGRPGPWRQRSEWARTPLPGCGTSWGSSRGRSTRSRYRPTRTSRPSCVTWSVCTWTHRPRRRFSASTRRRSARRWIGPSRAFPCGGNGQRQ